ncbi:histone-lysine N-methyltransferase, H3 lysine-79 specific-like isoform X2 [Artemia franciscana]|uniref:histone-lysine N-methyltransferase, H3 lysine-79 specific-like isoform X2 n=1 Tax=Artemia franciscana TaxID=6661 RepID=UPI0032DBA333
MHGKEGLLDAKKRQWEIERAEADIWDPWGRPGGGAPVILPADKFIGMNKSKSKPELNTTEKVCKEQKRSSTGIDKSNVEPRSAKSDKLLDELSDSSETYDESTKSTSNEAYSSLDVSYHRGKRLNPDPEVERKRRQALEIREVLRRQVEERAERKRVEEARRRLEEEHEEERLKRQIAEDKRQFDEDQRKLQEKKTKNDSRVRVIQIANEKARAQAEEEKRKKRSFVSSSEGMSEEAIYETISGSESGSVRSVSRSTSSSKSLPEAKVRFQDSEAHQKYKRVASPSLRNFGIQTQSTLDLRNISTMTCPEIRSISTQTDTEILQDLLGKNIKRYNKYNRRKMKRIFGKDSESDLYSDCRSSNEKPESKNRQTNNNMPRSRISFKLGKDNNTLYHNLTENEGSFDPNYLHDNKFSPTEESVSEISKTNGNDNNHKNKKAELFHSKSPDNNQLSQYDLYTSESVKSSNQDLNHNEAERGFGRISSPPVPAVAKRLQENGGIPKEKWEVEGSEKSNFEDRMLKLATVFSNSRL